MRVAASVVFAQRNRAKGGAIDATAKTVRCGRVLVWFPDRIGQPNLYVHVPCTRAGHLRGILEAYLRERDEKIFCAGPPRGNGHEDADV